MPPAALAPSVTLAGVAPVGRGAAVYALEEWACPDSRCQGGSPCGAIGADARARPLCSTSSASTYVEPDRSFPDS